MEEELANYFSNPSYRAANPELLEPVDLCHHEPHRNFLNRQQSLKRGRGICKEEGKEEEKTGGEGIIISITWTIINDLKLKEEL